MQVEYVPLKDLISDGNVRRTIVPAEADDELLASIREHGLLDNLVIYRRAEDDAPVVIAGNRRLNALRSLSEYTPDSLISCNQIETIDGREGIIDEIGLAENIVRVPLHPADQVEAFARLVDSGSTIGEIAARFGVAERTVLQRLRLGKLHPDLLALYRKGSLQMGELQAFTFTEDQKRQKKVLKALQKENRLSEWCIRDALQDTSVEGTAPVAQFVGRKAYEDAGGTIIDDLFPGSRGADTFFDNRTLLLELAMKKLQSTAARLVKDGWKWADCYPEVNPQAMWELKRVLPLDGEVYGSDRMAVAGCFVSLKHDGKPIVNMGYVKPEDMKEARPFMRRTAADAPSSSSAPETNAAKEAGIPKGAHEELRALRTAMVKGTLMFHSDLARDLLTFELATRLFNRFRDYGDEILAIEPTEVKPCPSFRVAQSDYVAGPGGVVLTEAIASFVNDQAWLDSATDRATRWDAFRDTDDSYRMNVLTLCVATMLVQRSSLDADPIYESVVGQIQPGFHMIRPDLESVWSKLPKATIQGIVTAAAGEDVWETISMGRKKAEIATAAHALFQDPEGSGLLTPERQEAVKGYVLPALAAPAEPAE